MDNSIIVSNSVFLEGSIQISGAKNSILPILCASLLTNKRVELSNVPNLNDVKVLRDILDELGKPSEMNENNLTLFSHASLTNDSVNISEAASRIRYSVLILGALLALGKEVNLPMPGGCSFSERPIDIHLEGLKKLGARIEEYPDKIVAKATRLKGTQIKLRFPSVGATENLIIAACLAEGETLLENIAKEPEIDDLVSFLNKSGANIIKEQPGVLRIEGVEKLNATNEPIKHRIIPDRIEAATFIILGALAAKDYIMVKGLEITHNLAFLNILQKIGVNYELISANTIKVYRSKNLIATQIKTNVYPEVATDIQPLLAVLLTQAEGESEIIDTIYPSRFQYIEYLNMMGAKIDYIKDSGGIKIAGPTTLSGQKVWSTDLRGGAAVLLAGIIAENDTLINNSYQIFRGYSELEQKLFDINVKLHNSTRGGS
jgi:UDP-N-acetylglucosamine 1-carboxyvinyltransferase